MTPRRKPKTVIDTNKRIRDIAQKYRKRLIANITKAEKSLKDLLDEKSIVYQFQKIFYTEKSFYIVDFFFISKKKKRYVIEVDGSTHDSKEAKKKDAERDSWFRKKGIKVFRFTNQEVFKIPHKILQKSKRELTAQKYRQRLIANITKAEKSLKDLLDEKEVVYQFQKIFFTDKSFYISDFYFKSKRGLEYIIEVDGSTHDSKEAKKKDAERDSWFRKKGIKVFRFTNQEVFKIPHKILQKSKRELTAQKYRQRLIANITKAEKSLKDLLDEKEVVYQFQKIFFTDKSFYISDFYFKSKRGLEYIIEVDGSTHDSKEAKNLKLVSIFIENSFCLELCADNMNYRRLILKHSI